MPESNDWLAEYAAFQGGVGVARCWPTQIEVTGRDRAGFLNRLCTNQVDRLTDGQACETFLTNAKGHVLGHGFVLARPDALILRAAAGQAKFLMEHLEYYLIHDAVVLRDRSTEWSELLLAGPGSQGLLARFTSAALPAGRLAAVEARVGDDVVWILPIEESPQPVFLLSADAAAIDRCWSGLRQAGAEPCGGQALEAFRIEFGWPEFGRDIDPSNLPQEVGRDWAISFRKGCYLGQETVARIDSRGHVNRLLVRLRFDGAEIPSPGTPLLSQGRPVGHVTSAAYSPQTQSAVALGYVRRELQPPDCVLDSAAGRAMVVGLAEVR